MKNLLKLTMLSIVVSFSVQESEGQLLENSRLYEGTNFDPDLLENEETSKQKAVTTLKALKKKYNVPEKNYPQIKLGNVSEEAYEKGKIQIKFSPEVLDLFDTTLITTNKSYVTLPNAKLNKLNKKFKAKQYKSSIHNLYTQCPEEKKFTERHKAWGFHQWYEVEISKRADVKEAVAAFLALHIVEEATPVYKAGPIEPIEKKKLKTLTVLSEKQSGKNPDDTYYQYQWGYEKIEAPQAWHYVTGNPSVIVGVFGSGVQFEHPDLKANMWQNIGPEGALTTPSDHETHVAGTIAAVSNNNTGVAGCAGGNGEENSGVKIMSLDILGDNISKYEAYVYAADHGAAISQNSWGYNSPNVYDPRVLMGIDYFNTYGGGDVLEGGITIFSAGNDASDEKQYPGYYDEVIAVAATDKNDKLAEFSNYGTWVDIAAPGVDIYSTISGGAYGYKSGTSMACPHVSGIAALILSYAPGQLTNDQLKDLLLNNTDTIDYLNPAYEGKMGTGRLNAHRAISQRVATVNNKPEAAFSSTDQSTIVGKNIGFSDASTNLPIAWEWTFEAGFPETSQSRSPRVTWTEPGTYDLQLIVSNTQGSDTLHYEDYITINNINAPSINPVQVGTNQDGVSGYPLGMPDSNSCSASVYLKDEIGGSGIIDSLAWFTTTAQFERAITIYLKQTTDTELKPDTWDNAIDGATMVYTGNISNHAGQWTTIALDNQFVYDSASNLMVMVSISSDSANYSSGCRYENTTGYNRHMQWSGITSALVQKEGKPGQQRPWIRINFANQQEVETHFFALSPDPYYKQAFDEGNDFPPENWLAYNSEGNVASWKQYTANHSYLSENTTGFAVSINQSGENWLITDSIILDEDEYALEWKVGAFRTDSYYLNSPYSILISSSNKETSSFSVLYDQILLQGIEGWEQHMIDLSAYSGDTIFLAFVHKKGMLCLDDVEVKKKNVSNVSTYEGEALKIFDNSTNRPTHWYWETPGANKESHTTKDVNLTYNKEGVYPVTLKSGNTKGSHWRAVTGFITVLGRTPISSFSVQGNLTAYKNFGPYIPRTESISYTDESIYLPTSWKWNFEGSNNLASNIQHPENIGYDNEGSFDVTLIAKNSTGSDTIIKEGYVTVGGKEYITNFSESDTETNMTRGGNDFQYTGHSDLDKNEKFAEKYSNQFEGKISALQVHVNTAKGDGKNVTFYVWDSENGEPGNILDSVQVGIDELEELSWNNITFDKPVDITGDFFAGYKISYDEDHDYDKHNFSVFFAKPRTGDQCTAFLASKNFYGHDEWNSFTFEYRISTSLAVNPEFTYACLPPSIDTIYGNKQVEAGKEYIYAVKREQGVTTNWTLPEGWTEQSKTDTSITTIAGNSGGYITATSQLACGNGEAYKLLVSVGNEKLYTIEATAGEDGTVEPSGIIEVLEGASQSFYFTPNAGYKIGYVAVDGNKVGSAGNIYTFTGIKANHTLTVEFVSTSTTLFHEGDERIKVYPNPVTEIIHIEGISKETIYIYNTLGTRVYKKTHNTQVTDPVKINVKNFAPGIYMISLIKNSDTRSIKIIKK